MNMSTISAPNPLGRGSSQSYAMSDLPMDTQASGSSPSYPRVMAFEDTVDNEAVNRIKPEWKRRLYMLLEQPTSSRSAFIVHVLTTFLIVLSALVTVLETVPSFHSIPGGIWFGIETTLVVLFTVEYVARCVSHSTEWLMLAKWVGSFFGIIDLLGILPYYIEIVMQQDTSTFFRFTILRTFRLLRVFRPFRHNHAILLTIEVMYLSFRRSQHALLALAFFVIMVLVVFSTLLYFAERGTWDEILGTFTNSDGDPSQFASIPACAWFVLVTITTVGYGEITPRSFLGRLVTLPLLVFGLLLIALPTFVLGREFSIVWDMMKDPNEPAPDDTLLSSPLLRRRGSSSVPNGPDALHPPSRSRDDPDLRSQVALLQATVDRQGELLRRIAGALEGKGKRRAPPSPNDANEDPYPRTGAEANVRLL